MCFQNTQKDKNYEQICNKIDSYTKVIKLRDVLKSKLIYGMTYDEILEEHGFRKKDVFSIVMDFLQKIDEI